MKGILDAGNRIKKKQKYKEISDEKIRAKSLETTLVFLFGLKKNGKQLWFGTIAGLWFQNSFVEYKKIQQKNQLDQFLY